MNSDPNKDPEDALTDALLREHARAGSGPDESFLAQVEKSIDADDRKITSIPTGPRRGVSPFWAVAAGLAILAAVATQFITASNAHKREAALAQAAQLEQQALNNQIATLSGQLHAAKQDLVTRGHTIQKAALEQNESQTKIINLETELARATTDLNQFHDELEKWSATMATMSSGDISMVEEENAQLKAQLAQSPQTATGIAPVAHPFSQPVAGAKPLVATAPSSNLSPPQPTTAPNASAVSAGSTGTGVVMGPAYGGRTITGNDASPRHARLSLGDSIITTRGNFGDADGYYQPEALRRDAQPVDRERYGELVDNRWDAPFDYPLSTFSIDVDTASYTNLRRMINDGSTSIPHDAVRIEEMINYFNYRYPQPKGDDPFAFAIETAQCPWNEDHRLIRVGLQARDVDHESRPPANLTFLLDVSGSMDSPDKLPLVIESMKMLTQELQPNDRVAIAVYAGAQGLVLNPTDLSEKPTILNALKNLKAGGSTNGGAGIELAYQLATDHFIEDGINRVILCTDGDFNVGTTVQGDLVDLVKERAQGGVFLSVLGFGSGNINDAMLEAITNKGNGTYYYIDSLAEARKVFLEDLMSTLVTVAKDVKIQVEFNPAQVAAYRLIGYANRMLEAEDFEDDTVDAGDVGAGHRVTALYEIVTVPRKKETAQAASDSPFADLKYQRPKKVRLVESDDLLTVKLRYKEPDADLSQLLEVPVRDNATPWRDASEDFQFASASALFGMLLRDSEYCGDAGYENVLEIAAHGTAKDPKGRRKEFRDLVRKYRADHPSSASQR